MQIIAKCPRCGNSWLLDGDATDKRRKCRNCNHYFKVPKLNELDKALEAIDDAKGTVYADQAGNLYG